MGDWHRAVPAAAIAALSSGLWLSGDGPVPAAALRLTIGVAEVGRANRALGETLAREYARERPGPELSLIESSYGAVDTLQAIQGGATDCGITAADVSYLAFAGRLDGYPGRFERLRGVAVLDVAPVHLMVAPNAAVRDVSDLRGRSVNIGLAGSETRFIANIILRGYGLEPSDITAETLPFSAAASKVAAGRLDAMFATAAHPADFVTSATHAGARLVPLQGPRVARLRDLYRFLQLARIPAGSYPGHDRPVLTIGIEKVLVCRQDLPDRVVYDLTSRLFRVLPAVAASLQGTRFTALEHAPATPIPLHAGAARYYRERELFR